MIVSDMVASRALEPWNRYRAARRLQPACSPPASTPEEETRSCGPNLGETSMIPPLPGSGEATKHRECSEAAFGLIGRAGTGSSAARWGDCPSVGVPIADPPAHKETWLGAPGRSHSSSPMRTRSRARPWSALSLEAGWLADKERPHLALASAIHWVRTADHGELLDRFPKIEPQLSPPLGAYWRTARYVRLTGQASFWSACEPGRQVASFWAEVGRP